MWLALIRLRHERFRLALPLPMIVVWLFLLAAATLCLVVPGRAWRRRAIAPGLVWDCMRHCAGTNIQITSRDGTEVVLHLV
jgi:hypothetical protein